MKTVWSKFTSDDKIFVLTFFGIGILFRLILTWLVPQGFAFDQGEYDNYARIILDDPLFLASYSHRPYGYPLFLAIVYSIFGIGNREVVFFIQAILDSLIGVLIYLTLRHLRGSRLGLALYSLNPFTAAYTGVILSEILATFLLMLSLVLGIRFIKIPSKINGFIFGFILSLSGQTRIAAFLWMLIPLGILFLIKRRHLFAIGLGIIVPVLYPLYVNWRDWRQLTPTTVDNIFVKEFYIGTLTDRPKAFSADLPAEVHYFYRDFYTQDHGFRTQEERRDITAKYFNLSVENIRKAPKEYFRKVGRKILYLWHTDSLFPYQEPGYENHRVFTFWVNAFLLIFAVIGLVKLGKLGRFGNTWLRWLWFTIVVTLIYATLTISLTIADHRLTIPFYPIIISLAALGFNKIWSHISH